MPKPRIQLRTDNRGSSLNWRGRPSFSRNLNNASQMEANRETKHPARHTRRSGRPPPLGAAEGPSAMKRVRFQFGLRGLLILTTALGMGLAYLGARLRAGSKQAALETELAARGGTVYFENSFSDWLPDGWRARLGWRVPLGVVGPGIDDEALQIVGQLHGLRHLRFEGTKITDAGLAHLKGLSTVEYLDLTDTDIGDAGLKSVAALCSLTTLKLRGTRVSDEGLVHLAPLEKLERLEFDSAAVTHAGCLHVFVDMQGRSVVEGLKVIGLAHGADKELSFISLGGPHGTPRLIRYLQRTPGLREVALSAPLPSLEVLDELRNLPNLERAWIDDTGKWRRRSTRFS